MRERSSLSCAATSATERIQSDSSTTPVRSWLEHEWSPAIAVSAAQSIHAGMTLCVESAPCSQSRCSLAIRASRHSLSKTARCSGSRLSTALTAMSRCSGYTNAFAGPVKIQMASKSQAKLLCRLVGTMFAGFRVRFTAPRIASSPTQSTLRCAVILAICYNVGQLKRRQARDDLLDFGPIPFAMGVMQSCPDWVRLPVRSIGSVTCSA